MISAIILAKNEEKHIKMCIESLAWCDEILVIDDNSTDKTEVIAEKLRAKVIKHPLRGDFAEQRNFALSNAAFEWAFFVDADESVSPALQYEILSHISNPMNVYNGFYIKRSDEIWGRKLKYGENGAARFLRVGRKEKGVWAGRVHEVWKMQGKTLVLQHPIHHMPHENLTEFLSDINYYTTLRAEELKLRKVRVSISSIIFYPLSKFFVNYIVKRGILDGIAGLIVAILMCFHSFLVRGKLWLLWQKK